MRTKALLGLAALAACAVTASAQNVYSLNIVGYVNTPISVGYNILNNPLDNGTNTVSSLFTAPHGGDTIYVYSGGTFTSSRFALGAWTANLSLPPGVGFFYSTSVNETNTFVGNVLTGNLTNNLPAGYSLIGSQAPQSDTLPNLNFPASGGDTVYFYRSGAYVSSRFALGAWNPSLSPGVGEGFWLSTSAAKVWWRVFNP